MVKTMLSSPDMERICFNFTRRMLNELLVSLVRWRGFLDVSTVVQNPRIANTDFLTVERHFESLKESFAWDQISGRKVIDVGGGSGHMSVALARVSNTDRQAF